MAISWTTINNGDTLLNIRNAINTFNSSVVTDVNTNSTNITSLQALNNYNYNKVTSFTSSSTTYVESNKLTVVTPATGTYQVTISLSLQSDTIANDVYFRYSFDGGTTYTEVRERFTSTADTKVFTIADSIPLTQTGAVNLVAIVECRVAVGTDTVTIPQCTIISDRKV